MATLQDYSQSALRANIHKKKSHQQFSAPFTPSAGQPFVPSAHTGVVLMNMGGPDDAASVKPFLYNLFSDPDIIKLPLSWLLQPLLAKLIVSKRGDEAIDNYAKMDGFNGGSPQLPITRKQAALVQQALDNHTRWHTTVAIAMRYWHPTTKTALTQLRAAGVQQLVLTSLYPQFSFTTTGSNLNEIRRVLNAMNWDVPITMVSGYSAQDWYLTSLAECIQAGLDSAEWQCDKSDVQILFSAHSLPVKHVTRTGDPYPELIERCIDDVMTRYFPNHNFDLAYQSKVGNFPWLGPPTDGVLNYYAGKQQNNILVVPISFVSDHIETLVEIDMDYIGEARGLGITHIARAPVMNTQPSFLNGLAHAIDSQLAMRAGLPLATDLLPDTAPMALV